MPNAHDPALPGAPSPAFPDRRTPEQPNPAGCEAADGAQVFALWGVEPEVLAYAMARYSRSALSLTESLREIDRQKAEKFLNTFYFQYGHRSIADLAHVGFAIERLSLLAAIEAVDENRWDGQERSTRYQRFRSGDWHVPAELTAEQRTRYETALAGLFQAYHTLSEKIWRAYCDRTPCPEGMEAERFARALRARAFDVARYLLPLATMTSLGQIVSARTLESQIARLLSSEYAEVRELGQALKQAAATPAYDPRRAMLREAAQALGGGDPALASALEQIGRPAPALPTLVKYAEPNPYLIAARRELRQLAQELLGGAEPQPAARVTLIEPGGFELEAASTLLYGACDLPYQQITEFVSGLSARRRKEILETGLRRRGAHDELAREWRSGYGFLFDIFMDLGGFRDLHRHRRCVQIHQAASFQHGYETPAPVIAYGAAAEYQATLLAARQTAEQLPATAAPYLISLAYRKRTLFKMDAAEAAYLIELRTAPGGHFSYRETAWEMFEALRQRYPDFAEHLRVRRPDPERELAER